MRQWRTTAVGNWLTLGESKCPGWQPTRPTDLLSDHRRPTSQRREHPRRPATSCRRPRRIGPAGCHRIEETSQRRRPMPLAGTASAAATFPWSGAPLLVGAEATAPLVRVHDQRAAIAAPRVQTPAQQIPRLVMRKSLMPAPPSPDGSTHAQEIADPGANGIRSPCSRPEDGEHRCEWRLFCWQPQPHARPRPATS